MNYYFLLEDEKSFIKVLPKWLEYMGFEAKRVADISEVTTNTYVMQSGQGVTQLITKALYQTLDTILCSENRIDSLVVIVDSEEETVEARRQAVYNKISEYKNNENVELDFEVKVIVCNHCFETWLLGNEEIYPVEEPKVDSIFYPHYVHYNVKEKDPEYMLVPEGCKDTIAKYHFHYLHDAFLYKRIRYNKNKPESVAAESYFIKLVERMNKTIHIRSFKELYDYICEHTENGFVQEKSDL